MSTKRGVLVLAAPGVGKSWFVQHHEGWYDADELMAELGLRSPDWHTERPDLDDHQSHYERCDQETKRLRDSGRRIVSSLFWDVIPDAIVLLDEEVHRQRVALRPDLEWSEVQRSVKCLESHAKEYNVPVYSSLEEADRAL